MCGLVLPGNGPGDLTLSPPYPNWGPVPPAASECPSCCRASFPGARGQHSCAEQKGLDGGAPAWVVPSLACLLHALRHHTLHPACCSPPASRHARCPLRPITGGRHTHAGGRPCASAPLCLEAIARARKGSEDNRGPPPASPDLAQPQHGEHIRKSTATASPELHTSPAARTLPATLLLALAAPRSGHRMSWVIGPPETHDVSDHQLCAGRSPRSDSACASAHFHSLAPFSSLTVVIQLAAGTGLREAL